LRTLFFRIFISFWLAMAMILAGAIAVTATVAWYRTASLESINPGELMNDATVALRNQGISGLKTWLEGITSAHPDLDIYVVDASAKDVLQRPLPERIERLAVCRRRDRNRSYFVDPPLLSLHFRGVSCTSSRANAQTIKAPVARSLPHEVERRNADDQKIL
jgi:hypothetical protein